MVRAVVASSLPRPLLLPGGYHPLLTSIESRICVYRYPSRLHPVHANDWYVFPNHLLFRFGDNCPRTVSTNAALSLVAKKQMWRHGQYDGRAYQPGVGDNGGLTTLTESLRFAAQICSLGSSEDFLSSTTGRSLWLMCRAGDVHENNEFTAGLCLDNAV
jgi:hypothetical protein